MIAEMTAWTQLTKPCIYYIVPITELSLGGSVTLRREGDAYGNVCRTDTVRHTNRSNCCSLLEKAEEEIIRDAVAWTASLNLFTRTEPPCKSGSSFLYFQCNMGRWKSQQFSMFIKVTSDPFVILSQCLSKWHKHFRPNLFWISYINSVLSKTPLTSSPKEATKKHPVIILKNR